MRRGTLTVSMVLLGAGAAAAAGAAGAVETYAGTASVPQSARPASIQVTVTIREYTSDDLAFALTERLHKDGHVAAVAEMAKGDVGTVRLGDGPPLRATLIRQEKTANGRIVRIVTERPLQVAGGSGAPTPPDTVGYVELTLDASGKGTGRLLSAVKATFDAEGYVVPESQGETWAISDVKPGP
jgi:hypothetical protein